MKKINVGIVGFGSIGKNLFELIKSSDEFELVAVFSRRKNDVEKICKNCVVESYESITNYIGKIEIMFMCGGSFNDVENIIGKVAEDFCTVDSFDNHKKIFDYKKNLNTITKQNKKTSVCSCGWDPGLFSIIRAQNNAVLDSCVTNCFWGKGVSQGHTNAIKSVKGVIDAIQYTIPIKSAIKKAEAGCVLTNEQKHFRKCFVVCKKSDFKKIKNDIKSIPDYFFGYKTIVKKISQKRFNIVHAKNKFHGGEILTIQKNNKLKSQIYYRLNLDNNAYFTSCIMSAYARACYKLYKQKKFGAYCVLDIAPKLLLKFNDQNYIQKYV